MKYLKCTYLLIAVFLFSCSNSDTDKPENETAVVAAELLYFTFDVDEVNETFVLDYKIKLTNTSSVNAIGNVFVTLKNEGDSFTHTNSPSNDCNFIMAGESCIFSFYQSESYDPEVTGGRPSNVLFVKAEYIVEK